MRQFVESVANKLEELGDVKGCGYILSDYLGHFERAVEILCGAGEWSNAIEVCGKSGDESDLKTRVLIPLVVENADSRIVELIETTEKLLEKTNRLRVVRQMKEKKKEREDDEGSDIFSESDAGSIASDFTFGSGATATTAVSTTASLSLKSTSTKRDRYAARRKHRTEKKRKRITEVVSTIRNIFDLSRKFHPLRPSFSCCSHSIL